MMGCNKYLLEEPELWITYDPIDGYVEPSEDAEVGRQFTNVSFPFTIQGKDVSGKWGRHVVHGYFGRSETYWLPLDQMIYVGHEHLDTEEEMETSVVTAKDATLYKHPKADKKDVIKPPLHQGDTVQVTARVNGWSHIRKFQYNRTAYSSNRYGWVADKDLKGIGMLAAANLDESAYNKAERKVEERKEAKRVERAKRRGIDVESEEFQKVKKTYSFYEKIYRIIAIVSLVLWLVFRGAALRRDEKTKNFLLLLIAPALYICGYFCDGPSWFFALAIPIMVYVVLYPLLYLRSAKLFEILYVLVSLVAGGFYLYQFSKGGTAKWVLILLGIAVVLITLAILVRISDDICPRCGYFAGHVSGPRTQVGPSKTSVRNDTYKTLTHTTTETVGNTVYITDHYKTGVKTTTTTTTNYEVVRTCGRCGHQFKNFFSVTNKSYS